jgi:hypothetical protein
VRREVRVLDGRRAGIAVGGEVSRGGSRRVHVAVRCEGKPRNHGECGTASRQETRHQASSWIVPAIEVKRPCCWLADPRR